MGRLVVLVGRPWWSALFGPREISHERSLGALGCGDGGSGLGYLNHLGDWGLGMLSPKPTPDIDGQVHSPPSAMGIAVDTMAQRRHDLGKQGPWF